LIKKQQLTQIEQAEQDEITLNYEKWQARQIEANHPSHYVLWTEERDAVLQRQSIEKDTARQNRLNNLKVERRAKSRENESDINLELTTEMNRLRSQWLTDNPKKTESDFEKVRPLFRELLLEQLYTDTLNKQVQSLNKKP
jgi:tRNA uridine 5-carbamoylmethylation protein Kti12